MLNQISHSYRNFVTLLLCTLFGGSFHGCNGSKPESPPTPINFSYMTNEAGLSEFKHENGAAGNKWFPEPFGSGCGFIDYDGDNWIDIIMVGGSVWPQHSIKHVPALWLYRNNGDGTFTNKTDEAGLDNLSVYGIGVCAADYDNDDDQDLFFTTLYENMLFRNDDGVFHEVGKEAGLANQSTLSSSAVFFDADRDGWLDLYVGNYIDWSPEKDLDCTLTGEDKAFCTPEVYEGVPSRFYRNNGNGTFTDLTKEAGFMPSPGKTLGIVGLDFNKDSWIDLVISNDTERHLLYENNGDGTFTEKGIQSGIAFDERGKTRAGMGIDAGFIDNSGEVSIILGHFQNEMIGVYRHISDAQFIDLASISRIGWESFQILTFGLFLFDVEYDSDLDLFAANGHVQIDLMEKETSGIRAQQQPHLYLNNGEGIFDRLTQDAGGLLSETIIARGAAYADYDRDGDLDILMSENNGPLHLWRNDSKHGNFLRVRLKGKKSNRDGIGAFVSISAANRTFSQHVRTGASYLSQSELMATFGLGEITLVDTLRVNWPSGQVDTFTNIMTNQEIRIVEGVKTFIREFLDHQPYLLSKRVNS